MMNPTTLRKEFRAGFSLFYRDMIKLFRERARIIGSLMQPIIFLGILGLGLKGVLGSTGPFQDIDYIQYIFPGIIATNVLATTIGNGVTIVADREFGFLREVLVAPISRLTIALGKVAAGVGAALVQVALIMLLSPLVGLTPDLEVIVKLVAATILLAIATSSLGVFIATRLRSTESFQYVFQFLIFPLFFLSGAYFVLASVPAWIEFIARLNPLTYAIDLFHHILYADIDLQEPGRSLLIINSVAQDIVVIVAISAVLLALSTISFARTE